MSLANEVWQFLGTTQDAAIRLKMRVKMDEAPKIHDGIAKVFPDLDIVRSTEWTRNILSDGWGPEHEPYLLKNGEFRWHICNGVLFCKTVTGLPKFVIVIREERSIRFEQGQVVELIGSPKAKRYLVEKFQSLKRAISSIPHPYQGQVVDYDGNPNFGDGPVDNPQRRRLVRNGSQTNLGKHHWVAPKSREVPSMEYTSSSRHSTLWLTRKRKDNDWPSFRLQLV
ncbi:MAG: hypothetical protein R3C03_17875 [Pirellulaceae bacterium]